MGIEAGYDWVQQRLSDRPEQLVPIADPPPLNSGTANDSLVLRGPLIGSFVALELGDDFPILLRLSAGVLWGRIQDDRKGTFRDSSGTKYVLNPSPVDARARYFYVAPEARIGGKLSADFDVFFALSLPLFVGFDEPSWDEKKNVRAGSDGVGTFPADRLVGDLLILASPRVGAHYRF